MKRYFLIAVFSALCSFLHAQTHINITTAQWQEDIRYFKEQMVKKHMNAFHRVSKEEYEKDMEQLYNDVPSLKDYQIIVRLKQVTSKIGDGHTRIHMPASFKHYPVRFNWFGDELYVIASIPRYREALGTRLSKIGNTTVEEIKKKIATVMSQDENKWYEMSTGAYLVTVPEVLHSLGIAEEYDHASFILIDSSGREFKMDMPALAPDLTEVWIPASKSTPLFRKDLANPFWFSVLFSLILLMS